MLSYDMGVKSPFEVLSCQIAQNSLLPFFALNVALSLKGQKSCSAKASTIFRVSSPQRKSHSNNYFCAFCYSNF